MSDTELPEGMGLKKIHAEPGHIEVEYTAPPEVVAAIVEPLIEMLGDAPNYVEAKVIIGKANEPRYVLTVSRLLGKTPRELRRQVETERDRYRAALEWIANIEEDALIWARIADKAIDIAKAALDA